MPQKPSFHGKRNPRKQSSSQTHCQLCKPSCLVNMTQRKRSSQRTSAPSLSLPVLFFSGYQYTPALWGNEMTDQLAKEGREKEQPPSHLSCREVKILILNKKKAIFHSKTGGFNPNQDALHQLPRCQQTTIFCLRTGHCRLISNLKRIGVKTLAQCPCWEADQTHLCVPQNQALGVCRGFAPDIQVCRTHRRDLVNATITLNTEEEVNNLIFIKTVCKTGLLTSFWWVVCPVVSNTWACNMHTCKLAAQMSCLKSFLTLTVGTQA